MKKKKKKKLVIDIFLLFSSLACLILYGYYREKFCLGHSCELKGYISLSLFVASPLASFLLEGYTCQLFLMLVMECWKHGLLLF